MVFFPVVDATDEAPDELHYPEIVARLESLGFSRVGRVRLDVPPAEWQKLLSQYTPYDAEQMALHERVPDVVLVAPSEDAYVDVGWFYDSPSLRFRTALQDGTVVETQRPWDNDPAWPVRLHRALPHRDRREEQLCEVADGRDLALSQELTPDAVWREHQARVAAAGAPPIVHRADMEQVLELWNRFLAHALRCAERAGRIARLFTMLLPLVAAVVSVWLTSSDRVVAAVAVVLVLGVLPVALTPRVAIRTRYVRRLRPAWR